MQHIHAVTHLLVQEEADDLQHRADPHRGPHDHELAKFQGRAPLREFVQFRLETHWHDCYSLPESDKSHVLHESETVLLDRLVEHERMVKPDDRLESSVRVRLVDSERSEIEEPDDLGVI